jgi:hypothetical protein
MPRGDVELRAYARIGVEVASPRVDERNVLVAQNESRKSRGHLGRAEHFVWDIVRGRAS